MKTKTMMLAALAFAALALAPRGAQAVEYPWCLFSDPWTYNCGFATLQQCVDTRNGAGGICQPNPRATSTPNERTRRNARPRQPS